MPVLVTFIFRSVPKFKKRISIFKISSVKGMDVDCCYQSAVLNFDLLIFSFYNLSSFAKKLVFPDLIIYTLTVCGSGISVLLLINPCFFEILYKALFYFFCVA